MKFHRCCLNLTSLLLCYTGIPKYSIEGSAEGLDPVKIWEHHKKELLDLLEVSKTTLISLSAGLHVEDVIDKETKVMAMTKANGREVLFDAVKERIADGSEAFQVVLDVMDRQDQLCGLVRRIRRELGLLKDKKKKNILQNHHDQIVEILHTKADSSTLISLCGGFLSKGLIDEGIFHRVSTTQYDSGPNELLKCLEDEVTEDPDIIISITAIMSKEEPLEEVAKEMEEEFKKQQATCYTPVKILEKFQRPQLVIEQLRKDNSLLEKENIELRKRECYRLLKVPLLVFLGTMSLYFVIRRFK